MYDLRCEELARVFVELPDDVTALAQAIQDAIEEWLDNSPNKDGDDAR